MSKKARQHTDYDSEVLSLIIDKPLTTHMLIKKTGLSKEAMKEVLARLRNDGMIEYTTTGSRKVGLAKGNAVIDPSPFPRPTVRTPNRGFFG